MRNFCGFIINIPRILNNGTFRSVAFLNNRLLLQQLHSHRAICSSHHIFSASSFPPLLWQQQRNRHKRRPTVYVGFDRPQPQRVTHILRTIFAGTLLIVAAFVLPAILDEGPSAALVEVKQDSVDKKDDDEENDDSDKNEKGKIGFRDRKIIHYENRIRMYSTPDKVFRYFATLKVFNAANNDFEVYMTPDDFLRSITPGVKQPENLGLDQFQKFDPEKDKLELSVPSDSIFYKIGENGLISFSDYMFLLTLLCTPWRYFEVAFRMFDLNGDGTVDVEEFERVQIVLRSQTAVGMRHRDHATTGNVIRSPVSSALSCYFFGKNLKGKLTNASFLQFRKAFLNDIQRMEFEQYHPENGRISELEFAEWLIAFAGYSEKKRRKIMKHLKKQFSSKPAEGKEAELLADSVKSKQLPAKVPAKEPAPPGITWEEYHNFCKFLHLIFDVDIALKLHSVSGSRVDRATLDRVARVICGFPLSERVLDVMFAIFDVNDDGSLSSSEFVGVMKRRLMRGLDHPKDTGFTRLIDAMWYCSKQAVNPKQF